MMNPPTLRPAAALLGLILIATLSLSCETTSTTTTENADPNSAAFVTRLGSDTLVVEQFVRTPTRMEADVVNRTPRTTVRHYVFEMDETGAMKRF